MLKTFSQTTLVLFFSMGSSFSLNALAQTVDARCHIYPLKEDQTSLVLSCTFSITQGLVRIRREDGVSYELTPNGSIPGKYIDQNGQAAYKQFGPGDREQIYHLNNESLYVYWDKSPLNTSNQSKNDHNPTTYTTVQDFNNIGIQISQGDFKFEGILRRASSQRFTGADHQIIVSLNPDNGHIVVINKVTGTEYNYYITPVSGLVEESETMCAPSYKPC